MDNSSYPEGEHVMFESFGVGIGRDTSKVTLFSQNGMTVIVPMSVIIYDAMRHMSAAR